MDKRASVLLQSHMLNNDRRNIFPSMRSDLQLKGKNRDIKPGKEAMPDIKLPLSVVNLTTHYHSNPLLWVLTVNGSRFPSYINFSYTLRTGVIYLFIYFGGGEPVPLWQQAWTPCGSTKCNFGNRGLFEHNHFLNKVKKVSPTFWFRETKS